MDRINSSVGVDPAVAMISILRVSWLIEHGNWICTYPTSWNSVASLQLDYFIPVDNGWNFARADAQAVRFDQC